MKPGPYSVRTLRPSTALVRRGLWLCTTVVTHGAARRSSSTKRRLPGRRSDAATSTTMTCPLAWPQRTSRWRTRPVPRSSSYTGASAPRARRPPPRRWFCPESGPAKGTRPQAAAKPCASPQRRCPPLPARPAAQSWRWPCCGSETGRPRPKSARPAQSGRTAFRPGAAWRRAAAHTARPAAGSRRSGGPAGGRQVLSGSSASQPFDKKMSGGVAGRGILEIKRAARPRRTPPAGLIQSRSG